MRLGSVWIAAALAVACGSRDKDTGEPFRTASIAEVEAMLGAPDVAIVDANVRDLFERHHLPGARFAGSGPIAGVLPADRDLTADHHSRIAARFAGGHFRAGERTSVAVDDAAGDRESARHRDQHAALLLARHELEN